MASPYYIPVDQPNPLTKMAEMMKVQEAMDEVGKKKKLARFLGSGADLNTTEGLRGLMELDPELGYKLAVKQSSIGANQALGAKYQAQSGQIGAKQLAGGAAMLVKQYETLPPEQRTPQAFTSIWGPAVQLAKQRGLAPPDMPLEGATYDQVKSIVVGAGFSPAEQAKAQLGQDELSEETQYDAARLGQYQQGIQNLEKNRGAVLAQDQSQFGSREARLGSEFRTREGNIGARADRNFRQGAYEFERGQGLEDRKFDQDAGMEERQYQDQLEGRKPWSGKGLQLGYDQQGRVVLGDAASDNVSPTDVDPRLAKLTQSQANKYKELATGQSRFENSLAQYEGLINEIGPTSIPGKNTAKLDNAYRDIQSQVRLLAGMGAPQAAELELLAKQLVPPTELLRNVAESGTMGAYDYKGSILAQLSQTKALADANKQAINDIYLGGQVMEVDPKKQKSNLRMPQPFRSPTQNLSQGSGASKGPVDYDAAFQRALGR